SPGPSQAPPPGGFDGVPPEPPGGARATANHPARSGLPPLEEEVAAVAAAAKQARQRATGPGREHLEGLSPRMHRHPHVVQDYSRGAERLSQEKDEGREEEPRTNEEPEAAVARFLKRPLGPAERTMVPLMLGRGMRPAEVAAELQKMATPEK